VSDVDPSLPLVLAGPLLRRTTPERLVFWLAISEPLRVRFSFADKQSIAHYQLEPGQPEYRLISAGKHLHYLLIDLELDSPLPQDTWISYTLDVQRLQSVNTRWIDTNEWTAGLCYPLQNSPGFIVPSRVSSLLHGSCRKPHHPGGDGLVEADRFLARCLEQASTPLEHSSIESAAQQDRPAWPSMLVLTGDQIYADDVAGPMLCAIHQVVAMLGLPDEPLAGGEKIGIVNAEGLYRHPASLYQRETLLPRHKGNVALIEVLFGGVEKPVFTADSAHNHLITLGEVLAMYLLVWSPALWPLINLNPPPSLQLASRSLYQSECQAIEEFIAGLPAVQRLLAHVPTAMIFDDHDITDDWNLSRGWEEVAYGHPFSRRVIGNALLGYWLNQAWGNNPDAFSDELLTLVQAALKDPGAEVHDDLIDRLLRFDQWHYTWHTTPPLVVIDSRTHRWRSESSAHKPSGLMDWETLTDLQQSLLGLNSVLLVSPAPIFGVKLIEIIQRVFSGFGQPLMVDAENWMAHPGSANAILNIFRHPRTPKHFVVLSGDVHYSFVYDIELRGRTRGPDIWQICSSAIRNAFPPRLLAVLDHVNRWLYSTRSPLNWLTRRRHMRVIPRKPKGTAHGRRLLNGPGIGLVELDPQGVPWRIRELLTDGQDVVFERREAESRWN
tara:strand:- start:510 stop:2507 length:1998 start_codon:yes stop_codon:yes gene_type:complete